MRARYTAKAERSGDWWAVDVPEIHGVHTQARRLDRVEHMARDVIALMLEVPADSFDVEVEVELGKDIDALVATAVRARQKATQADREASDAVRMAVAGLLREGLTIRDAGRLLGVSHQRIAQLAPRGTAPADDRAAAVPLRMTATGRE